MGPQQSPHSRRLPGNPGDLEICESLFHPVVDYGIYFLKKTKILGKEKHNFLKCDTEKCTFVKTIHKDSNH